MNLFNEIQQLIQELNTSISLLARYGRDLAVKERDYKIILRQEALKLRTENNTPVTLINQVIYGVPEVASKRFDRDVAETMYQTALENINVKKLQLRVLENQLQREWGNADR